MTDDLAFLAASRLLQLYRTKELSPVEAMRATLARLERYEGALNAFVLYDPDSAIAAARAVARSSSRCSVLEGTAREQGVEAL